jgi:O-antigen ligase
MTNVMTVKGTLDVARWIALGCLLCLPMAKYVLVTYVGLGVDPSLLVFGALLWVHAVYFYRYPARVAGHLACVCRGYLGLMVAMSILMGLSLLWTNAPEYGLQKTIRFTFIGIPYLMVPAIYISDKRSAMTFSSMLLWIAVATSILTIILGQGEMGADRYGRGFFRTTLLGADPNAIAFTCVSGVVLLIARLYMRQRSLVFRDSVSVLFLAICLYSLYRTGSRAALCGTAMVLGFLLLEASRGRIHDLARGMALLLATAGILLWIGFSDDTLWDRNLDFVRMLHERDYASTTRAEAWIFCCEGAMAAPIAGHGVGSFAMDAWGVDSPVWPHNIVLEMLYELGIPGAACSVCLILLAAGLSVNVLCAKNMNRLRFMGALLFLGLLPFPLLHWDVDGSRYFYMVLGFIAVVQRLQRVEESGRSTTCYYTESPRMV